MKRKKIEIDIQSFTYEELNASDRQLIDKARKTNEHSYAPYSHFYVGAAVLLDNGEIICGSNQENAASPSGTCAERTALFYAGAKYPDQAVKAIAIAARNDTEETEMPVPPCGACRQVLLETEQRFHTPIRILLYGKKEILLLKSVNDLLPLSFGISFLK
ncbi:MAG TPA: cytidine deaminase [Candidatus Phocaeicola gallistercoris]|nr:cytidine deaminase [Candidatus Phocaeicola gallistercoris]